MEAFQVLFNIVIIIMLFVGNGLAFRYRRIFFLGFFGVIPWIYILFDLPGHMALFGSNIYYAVLSGSFALMSFVGAGIGIFRSAFGLNLGSNRTPGRFATFESERQMPSEEDRRWSQTREEIRQRTSPNRIQHEGPTLPKRTRTMKRQQNANMSNEEKIIDDLRKFQKQDDLEDLR